MSTYVHSPRIPEEGRVQAWRYGGTLTTVLGSGDTEVHEKILTGWRGDRELAETCARIWRDRDYTGWPSGPAAFFHEEFSTPRFPWSLQAPLARRFHGGWMRAWRRDHVPGPLYLYDLESAYLWAGSEGLPEKLRPYRAGDKRWIGVMEIMGGADRPHYFSRGRPKLVTYRDAEIYALSGKLLRAVSWREEDEISIEDDVTRWEGEIPARAYKTLTQSYWGRWAMTDRVRAEQWEDGEKVGEHLLKNPALCLPWAVLIVHRIMRKTYRATTDTDAVLVCVDSVLRPDPMDTGEGLGSWRLEERIGPEGVVVDGPGIWTHAPAPEDRGAWSRHSGFPSRARTERLRAEARADLVEAGDVEAPDYTASGYGETKLDASKVDRRVRELYRGETEPDPESIETMEPELEELDSMLRAYA